MNFYSNLEAQNRMREAQNAARQAKLVREIRSANQTEQVNAQPAKTLNSWSVMLERLLAPSILVTLNSQKATR